MTNSKASFWAKIALLSAALIWGSTFIMVKNVVNELPPHFMLAIRFTGGTIILSLVFYKKLKLISWDYIWRGAVIGLLLFLAYSTQTIGITDTTPGKNAFLTAVYCVFVPFLFWIIGKNKPDIFNILAAVLCIAGIGLVSLTKGLTIRFGDMVTLIGGFFFSAHMVSIAAAGKGKDPVLLTILQFAMVSVLSWGAGLTFEKMPPSLPTSSIFELIYLTVFATSVCLLLQNVGQKHTNPSSAAIILSLESVFGVIFSILFSHEQLNAQVLIGFVLIFLAIILSETKLSFILNIKKNFIENT